MANHIRPGTVVQPGMGEFAQKPLRSVHSPSPGQTLEDVAAQTGTPANEIRKMNPQIGADGVISPDMRLQI
jgi:LysM repeat protein